MLHLRRYFAALLVLLALYSGYALAVAPWMEPPPIRAKAPLPALPPVQIPDRVRDEILALFPQPDAWQRDATKVKVIETGQATLLIQDYLPTPDGKLELRPCTIIFYAAGGAANAPGEGSATAGRSGRRPIVLDAPRGATLEFDQPLDMQRSQWGRVRKGTLAGAVTIFSPPTQPGAQDGLNIITRDVRLDRDRIFTPHEVEFRYGENFGSGKDLTISLLDKSDDKTNDKKSPKSKSAFGGVQMLTLARLDRLHIASGGEGLAGPVQGRASKPAKTAQAASAPLELTCRGPFSFDMVRQIARFDDRVQVLRQLAGDPPERLNCETLIVEFVDAKTDDNKNSATQKASQSAGTDPLAGRLKRILAVGNPAVIESPLRAMKGVAASIEYSLENRRLTLTSNPDAGGKNAPPVTLHQAGQHFVASQLQYESAAEGQMGKLWAAGPGELRMVQGPGFGDQPIVARWQRELRVRPHEQNQLISLQGAASVILETQASDSAARLDAEELFLWLLPAPREGAVKVGPTALSPDRLLASGQVRLTSPQLDAETDRLEAWFVPAPTAPGTASPSSAITPPVAPLATPVESPAASQGAVIRQPNSQKFRVRGDKIQLQLVGQGRTFAMEDLLIQHRARIDEVSTPEFGQQPIQIGGDRVELHHGTLPQATITVTGKPAEAGGRGMKMIGGAINVNRGENRIWIDGPGEATLPAPAGGGQGFLPAMGSEKTSEPAFAAALPSKVKPPAGPPQTIHLDWLGGLKFDGQTVQLSGEVHARTATQRTTSQTLEAVLSQRVDLTATAAGPPTELARVIWTGNVFAENRGLDEQGKQLSLEQMQVPTLIVDKAGGKLYATGPGWVHSVRKSAEAKAGGPVRQVAQQPNNMPNKPLTNIHVAFDRAIVGDLAQRRIEFQERVRTTYSPANEFTDHIVAEVPKDLADERGMLMTSDRLIVTELITPSARWMELEATNNAYLEGRALKVQAASIRYSSDKEVVTVSGDGRADANIWHQATPGQKPSTIVVQKWKYFLRTGAWESDGIKHFDLQNINQLPIGGLRSGPGR